MQFLQFIVILASTMAGFIGLPAWAIAVTAPMLVLLSMINHRALYARAQRLGAHDAVSIVIVESTKNALIACTAAYALGYGLTLIG